MAIPLLQTKFHIPPSRPHQIPRPHLIERLNAGVTEGHQLIFVSAPAGFGKTTLLCDWAEKSGYPVAWLGLDATDNDADRFLAYLLAALQLIDERFGEGLLDSLRGERLPAPEVLLTSLINQINDLTEHNEGVGTDFIFVLDDFHVISNQETLGAVAFLLEHQPANMHLVIATRSDPPLPLARLRGMGLITELRQRDLRFTEEETGAFIAEMLGRTLLDEDIAVLTAKTEGWPAGLQMAAVSMKDRKDISAFITCFHGNDRYVLDYLLEEVLHRQTPFIQRFLLQTAVLDQLSGPLCDAVVEDVEKWHPPTNGAVQATTGHGAQSILDYLDAANLFIVPLDNERQWYRYHHLFADLLHQRLQQEYPNLEQTLHYRASKWFEQNNMIGRAIDHALSAADFHRASELITRGTEETLARSEMPSVQSSPAMSPEEGLTESEGHLPAIIDAIPTLAVLLEMTAVRGVASASRLLTTGAAPYIDDFDAPPTTQSPSLPELLSEREHEVLTLVAAGMSNQEIADLLFVAISTIKTHINHIYRKLDVANRTKAIIRAREIGLVDIPESTHRIHPEVDDTPPLLGIHLKQLLRTEGLA